jgi:arylformamidase
MEFTDISLLLHSGMPVWPKSSGFRLIPTASIAHGDPTNNSEMICDSHIGTHIDAPAHFITDGKTIENLSLEPLLGPATVIDVPNADSITAVVLDDQQIPRSAQRLLIKTKNSQFWQKNDTSFHTDFVALKPDAAEWIIQRKISLVGIDYLSIQPYHDGPETHKILLGHEVIILEGLNLSGISSGTYELICLPLKIMGAEGAPARAILRHIR